MNKENEDNLGDEAWDGEARRHLQSVCRAKGVCPEPSRLLEWESGALAGEAAAQIQTHLAACGLCEALLERMKDFDAGAALPPSEWAAMDQRVTRRFEEFLANQARPQPGGTQVSFLRTLARFFSRPVVAYAMVLLLCWPAYRGIFQRPSVVTPGIEPATPTESAQPVRSLESLKRIELKGDSRAPLGDDPEIRPGPGEQSIILSFTIPIVDRPDVKYYAEIRDLSGTRVVGPEEITPSDRLGNFNLRCARRPLADGSYELRVRSMDQRTGQDYRSPALLRFHVKGLH